MEETAEEKEKNTQTPKETAKPKKDDDDESRRPRGFASTLYGGSTYRFS